MRSINSKILGFFVASELFHRTVGVRLVTLTFWQGRSLLAWIEDYHAVVCVRKLWRLQILPLRSVQAQMDKTCLCVLLFWDERPIKEDSTSVGLHRTASGLIWTCCVTNKKLFEHQELQDFKACICQTRKKNKNRKKTKLAQGNEVLEEEQCWLWSNVCVRWVELKGWSSLSNASFDVVSMSFPQVTQLQDSHVHKRLPRCILCGVFLWEKTVSCLFPKTQRFSAYDFNTFVTTTEYLRIMDWNITSGTGFSLQRKNFFSGDSLTSCRKIKNCAEEGTGDKMWNCQKSRMLCLEPLCKAVAMPQIKTRRRHVSTFPV